MSLRNRIKEAWQTWQDYRAAERVYLQSKPANAVAMEFLPATLEIQETPPSPVGRMLLWGLAGFITIAVLWACFGHMDIVAVGQGKIIPSGRVKVIQPLETGVVRAIHVQEGQTVKAGDVLVELDLTVTEADRQRLASELIQITAEVARLNALLNGTTLTTSADVPPAIADVQQRLLENQRHEINARLAALSAAIEQQDAARRGVLTTIQRLESTIPLISQRAGMTAELAKDGLSSKLNSIALEEQRISQVKELENQRERLKEIEAALENARQQFATAEAEGRKIWLAELADKEQRRQSLTQELAKAQQRNAMQTLTAPEAGTIQELKINTIGGVVTPAQELMKLVPRQATLEAEVFLPNKDVGFVESDQAVEVKLEAFPFTKYGIVEGKVMSVSHDAIPDEKLGLVYAARISLGQATMTVNGKSIPLNPGMAVTAEIKTGHRRIIDYFLSPIKTYADESLRER